MVDLEGLVSVLLGYSSRTREPYLASLKRNNAKALVVERSHLELGMGQSDSLPGRGIGLVYPCMLFLCIVLRFSSAESHRTF